MDTNKLFKGFSLMSWISLAVLIAIMAGFARYSFAHSGSTNCITYCNPDRTICTLHCN